MAETRNKYVYGSVAEQIKYDPYEENVILKSKKAARNNARLKLRIVFNIFVIFAMFATIMFRYAQISQINYDNNLLNKEYVALQNQNELLSIEIQNAMDLNNIREVAENKLNMHKPDKSQIIYVSVPKQDKTILAQKQTPMVISVLGDVGNSIKRFLTMLYY